MDPAQTSREFLISSIIFTQYFHALTPWLPPQKAEVQALKARGGKSKVAGVILVFMFVACVSFTVTSNIMSIFPLTKCYRIAGGNGVLDPKTGKCPLK
ncbi:hypothetical protein DYB30_012429 [Aphanomyces astaci]|uniref:Uncharacterized protein n=2 Tax=Aphanomyces astaci TaxID=112090 RepID=A0A397CQ38_APHAT|nr:hypothetical protein DYB30_012429 [Aphanomyces astaci]